MSGRVSISTSGIVATGVADTRTGSWRLERPVVNTDRCTGCHICARYCPVGVVSASKPAAVDYSYCKGCGVCATVCPRGAILLVEEAG